MRPPLLEAPASAFLIFPVQALMLFFLFLALLYDVTELSLFALVSLAMGSGSYLWSRASLNRVTIKMTLNRERLFPDECLKVGIRAINAKFIPILFKIHFFIPKAVAGPDAGQWVSEESGLLWFQQIVFNREFFPNRRGVFTLGPPQVRTGDLFGFFLRPCAVKDRFEVVVYPRIVTIRSMAVPKREFFGIPGARSPVEDPIFVFGTRDYQLGRPARGIHWKASARHNRLQEKLCEPAEQEKVLILLGVDGFEAEEAVDDFENSLEVIAALVLQMDRRGIAVGFATNGNIVGRKPRIIPVSRNAFQMRAIIETLARVEAESAGPVTDILSRGYMTPRGVSSICFARNRSDQTRAVDVFMKQRNTPVQFVLARKSGDIATADARHAENAVYLKDLLAPGNRKR
jgi:uncharacterized protein (DUF58 family)